MHSRHGQLGLLRGRSGAAPRPNRTDRPRWRTWAATLALGLGSLACTGGGGGEDAAGGGELRIISCSLGCTRSVGVKETFQCGITDVYVNQEIRIQFNQPISLNSVTNNSFSVIETIDVLGNPSGRLAPGRWRLDSVDPATLIYTPTVTFDSSGVPSFGMSAGATYQLHILGTDFDDLGPYITSETGDLNRSRLLCTLLASRGVFDVNAGRPLVDAVTVDQAIVASYNANNFPTQLERGIAARDATDVFRDTDVLIKFDDVMDPGTLANIVTKQSATIQILVDPDANLSDPSDQLPIPGEYTLTLNEVPQFPTPLSPIEGASTTVLFRPSSGFPSGGSGGNDRLIVIRFSNAITDIAGNQLVDPGPISFAIEKIPFPTIDVTEEFTNQAFNDAPRSGDASTGGSAWGVGGSLLKGSGGGLGRLGDLRVPQGQTVRLNTDSEDFTSGLLTDPTVFNIQNVLGVDDLSGFKVDGGVFEFARLVIEPGARLRVEGSNPARLFVRGECIIQGTLDLGGGDGPIHDPNTYVGGVAGPPGAGAGAGGVGGARPDGSNMGSLAAVNPSLINPDPTVGPTNPSNSATYSKVNGQDGGGILVPDTLTGTPSVFGRGGVAWPQPSQLPAPNDKWRFPIDEFDAEFSFPFSPFSLCSVNAPGAVGAGAGHALDGLQGKTVFIPSVTNPPAAPEAPAGLQSELGTITPTIMSLDPDLGLLRGGGGGGGGGGHILSSRVNGTLLFNCKVPVGPILRVVEYLPASGAGGGAGGGGLQIQSGARQILNGVIDVSGGNGGSSLSGQFAQPGGGGSGGGVLLQSPQIQIKAIPARIDVRGGVGGTGAVASLGGDGSPGFIRLESFLPVPEVRNQQGAPVEEAKVVPTGANLSAKYLGLADIFDIFSTAEWIPGGTRPESQSGVQSCWFSDRDFPSPVDPTQTLTNFFELQFAPDAPPALGWDMMLTIDGVTGPQSYRGPNTVPAAMGMPLEQYFGNVLEMAPLVVRFQGAHATGALEQSCGVVLAGAASEIVPGSLTRWVDHPMKLTNFHGNPALTPNIFRFVILWDSAAPMFDEIVSIEDLTLTITPD